MVNNQHMMLLGQMTGGSKMKKTGGLSFSFLEGKEAKEVKEEIPIPSVDGGAKKKVNNRAMKKEKNPRAMKKETNHKVYKRKMKGGEDGGDVDGGDVDGGDGVNVSAEVGGEDVGNGGDVLNVSADVGGEVVGDVGGEDVGNGGDVVPPVVPELNNTSLKLKCDCSPVSGGALKDKEKTYKKYLNNMTLERLLQIARNKKIKVTTKKDGKIVTVKKNTVVNKLCKFKFH